MVVVVVSVPVARAIFSLVPQAVRLAGRGSIQGKPSMVLRSRSQGLGRLAQGGRRLGLRSSGARGSAARFHHQDLERPHPPHQGPRPPRNLSMSHRPEAVGVPPARGADPGASVATSEGRLV